MANDDSFGNFLYDSKTGKVLGRSGKSWTKILIFYVVYYVFLACLMYFSLGLYKNELESRWDTPRIQTRTDQPGMSAVPANHAFNDNLNKNFEFDPRNPKSYEEYVKVSKKFIDGYEENIQGQFTESKIEEFYRQGKVLYFLRVNKVLEWLPVGFNSVDEILKAGFVDEQGRSSLTFENDFQSKGVYFFCNSTSEVLDFEFIPIQVRTKERRVAYKDKGFISKAEYELQKKLLNDFITQPKPMKVYESVKAPFAAVAVSARYSDYKNNEGMKMAHEKLRDSGRSDEITEKELKAVSDADANMKKIINVAHEFTCYTVAKNIQMSRALNIGLIELGFTYDLGNGEE